MGWNNVPEELVEEPTNAEFEEELTSQTEDETQAPEDSEVVEEVTEDTEYTTDSSNHDEKQTANSPFAVLKVYGKYIPVETKEELIALAQQGIDYDNKMYKLKEWRNLINICESNPVLKDLSTRALKGEDITEYSVKSSNEPETSESSKFKDYIKKEVNRELVPYQSKIDELERKLFFEEMKQQDKENFDTVLSVCKEVYSLPKGHPNAMPEALKKQINEDKEVFKVYYNFIKDKVLAYKNNQPQPDVPEELNNTPEPVVKSGPQLKRSVKKAPILESAKGSEVISTSSLSDAEKIWKMPSSKFQEMMKKAESTYRR